MSIKHFIFFVFICLVLTSCSKKPQLNVICLIDFSSSVDAKTIDNYSKIITEDIFSNLSDNDRLHVCPIDEGSKYKFHHIISYDLSKMKFYKHHDGFAHKRDSINMRFSNFMKYEVPKINDALRKTKTERAQFENYTDIIGALQILPKEMNEDVSKKWYSTLGDFILGKPSYETENTIVILSDMIQDDGTMSFNTLGSSNTQQVSALLDKVIMDKKIPDLQKAKIFVHGATSNDRMHSKKQFENIEFFWEQFFSKANVDLASYQTESNEKIVDYLKARKAQLSD